MLTEFHLLFLSVLIEETLSVVLLCSHDYLLDSTHQDCEEISAQVEEVEEQTRVAQIIFYT